MSPRKTSKLSRFWIQALGGALLFGACDRAPPPVGSLPLDPKRAPDEPIVATVAGHAISAADVQREATVGDTPRAALDRLLDAEVLAREAARRGLLADHDVIEATRQARVQRLLVDFEKLSDKSAIPDRELEQAYNARLRYFVHPDMAQVWHILVPSRNATLADHAARRGVADEVARRAATVKSLDEFKAISRALRQPDGAPLVLEEVVADPQGVDKTFVKATMALHKPGDLSPVVETEFGFHIIYLLRQLPAQSLSLAQATPELRDKLALDFRVRTFARWIDERMHEHHLERHDDRLPGARAKGGTP